MLYKYENEYWTIDLVINENNMAEIYANPTRDDSNTEVGLVQLETLVKEMVEDRENEEVI